MTRSPQADHGYDVSDYCDVDPLFGDLAAFDTLVACALERELKVIVAGPLGSLYPNAGELSRGAPVWSGTKPPVGQRSPRS